MVSGDVRNVALLARRLSIAGIVFLGYLYFRLSGGGAALAAIGLISFVGVAQFLPALMGGLFWRGATAPARWPGLAWGLLVWLYCLFLPSFGPRASCRRRSSITGSGAGVAAALRAFRGDRDGPGGACGDVEPAAQYHGVFVLVLAAQLSAAAGAAAGRAVRQCVRSFRHARQLVRRAWRRARIC